MRRIERKRDREGQRGTEREMGRVGEEVGEGNGEIDLEDDEEEGDGENWRWGELEKKMERKIMLNMDMVNERVICFHQRRSQNV